MKFKNLKKKIKEKCGMGLGPLGPPETLPLVHPSRQQHGRHCATWSNWWTAPGCRDLFGMGALNSRQLFALNVLLLCLLLQVFFFFL